MGDLGLIPGLGRSPGVEEGYLLQYSSLENSMDCKVHGVAKKGLPDSSVGKELPAVQESPVRFLGWEDLLEKG